MQDRKSGGGKVVLDSGIEHNIALFHKIRDIVRSTIIRRVDYQMQTKEANAIPTS